MLRHIKNQEHRIASSAQELPSVSDHKARINAALCVLIRNCSRLSYLFINSNEWNMKTSARIKENAQRFLFACAILSNSFITACISSGVSSIHFAFMSSGIP